MSPAEPDSDSGTAPPESEANADWNRKMARRKQVHDARVATRTREQGLLMVHTGNGKGKTTAALGLILRAVGHGFPVALVQFIKGGWHPGELRALERFGDLVTCRVMGEGFTWNSQDRARDVAAAAAAWNQARTLLADPRYHLIVLDELTIALRYRFLDVDDILTTLTGRRPALHVLVTGRHAPPALIAAADLVTEMHPVKHPFQAGIAAQIGVEY